MTEEQLKTLITNSTPETKLFRKQNNSLYKMQFGDISIQFDCCLN
jgi:hypothetical protein